MRQKRAKAYKKQMNVYLHTFKFREPFQTIVDDELVLNCEKASFDIIKGLNRTIQGESKPMITQCCMQALYGTNNQKVIDIAKKFERRRCNHPPSNPLPPAECIDSITNVDGENKHRYIIASQDLSLRRKLRKIPGVPLIYMNRSVMVMEPLSEASAKYSESYERRKLTGGLNDAKRAGLIHDGQEEETKNQDQPVKKKRKGSKEPNPLSVKKKKTTNTDSNSEASKPQKKRRRRHNINNKDEGSNREDESNSQERSTPEIAKKSSLVDAQENSSEQNSQVERSTDVE